jgi:hypothetical protein
MEHLAGEGGPKRTQPCESVTRPKRSQAALLVAWVRATLGSNRLSLSDRGELSARQLRVNGKAERIQQLALLQ